MEQYFLEILFPTAVQPDDLEIITPASPGAPGRARLKRAYLGAPRPDAPNSRPLLSQSGATIGFVAEAELLEAPFTTTYWLVEA
jgi:hypothetical protein